MGLLFFFGRQRGHAILTTVSICCSDADQVFLSSLKLFQRQVVVTPASFFWGYAGILGYYSLIFIGCALYFLFSTVHFIV